MNVKVTSNKEAAIKINDRWQVRGGYAYFEEIIPDQTFNPDIPDAAINLLTAGFTRSWSSVVFDFALNTWVFDSRSVNNTVGNAAGASVDGTYKVFVPSIAFNITYRVR